MKALPKFNQDEEIFEIAMHDLLLKELKKTKEDLQ